MCTGIILSFTLLLHRGDLAIDRLKSLIIFQGFCHGQNVHLKVAVSDMVWIWVNVKAQLLTYIHLLQSAVELIQICYPLCNN